MFSGLPMLVPHVDDMGRQIPEESVLVVPWWFEHPAHGRITVPAGFVTDWGSTPQWARALPWFDPLRAGPMGPLPHDLGYCAGDRSRAEYDEILRLALIESGMSPRLARTWWLAVRTGGWMPWRRYRRRGRGLQPEDFSTREAYECAMAA